MGVRNGGQIDMASISGIMQDVTRRWYNARIQIVKPDISGGDFDRATNTKVRTPVVLWEGPARIQAMRWPNVATARQEAISARTVVFHIPMTEEVDPDLIHEGWRVHLLDGGLSKELEHGLFVITTTVNSSYAWDRRIETTMDQGTSV